MFYTLHGLPSQGHIAGFCCLLDARSSVTFASQETVVPRLTIESTEVHERALHAQVWQFAFIVFRVQGKGAALCLGCFAQRILEGSPAVPCSLAVTLLMEDFLQ
jgi:hypothetical protein